MSSIPTYITKHRQSYVLQRAVPRSLQQALGKRVWKQAGGMTLKEARAALQAFLDATEREIAIARGDLALTPDEQIDNIPNNFNLQDNDVVELLTTGLEVDEELSPTQKARALGIARGEATSGVFSGEDLIRIAASLKSPAASTKERWCKELKLFLDYCHTYSPLYCTREQAVAYRTDLLSRVSANSAKTKLAYIAGLWSILEEVKGVENIFRGITKRIKAEPKRKEYVSLPPTQWKDNKWKDLFLILHYTGCRLGEVAGLTYEDLKEDRITIKQHPHRALKNRASEREVPIHPALAPVVANYKGTGVIWPELENGGRWGNHLATPCSKTTGINPHGHRHQVATRLRERGFNEAVIGRLLGHTPNTITGSYGSIPWSKLVEAVSSL